MPEKDIKELQLDIQRADRIKNFLNSEVWRVDILPMLEEKKASLKAGLVWRGDTRTVDEVALACIYNSGAIGQIESIISKFDTYIKLGDIAREKLQKLEERKK